MSARSTFLEAWAAWDESCGEAAARADERKAREGDRYRAYPTGPDPKRTEALEVAAQAYATELSLTVTGLRLLAGAWRMVGMTREQAADAIERGLLVLKEDE